MSNQYDKRNIQTMERLYGAGYLSMGGDDEVARIIDPVDISGLEVLDLGCGLGGASIAMVRNHDAGRVCGIDIDGVVLLRARELVKQASLQKRIELQQFDPGPLPFADHSFDLVYLTAVSCHIVDLVSFFAEIKRIIRSDGCLIGAEWFRASDNQAYRDWDNLLRDRGLNFYFVTLDALKESLNRAGFAPVNSKDQSTRMAELATQYLHRVEHELKPELVKAMGEKEYQALLEWTDARARALREGGSGYAHFYAQNSSSPAPSG